MIRLKLSNTIMVKWTPSLISWYKSNFGKIHARSNECKSHCRNLSSSLNARKKIGGDDDKIITKKKRIVIRASDVAGIIGKNQYKKPHEIFDDMHKKYFPETFEGRTELELAQESLTRASAEEFSFIAKAIQYQPKDSKDAEKQIKKIEEKIVLSTTLSTEDKTRVLSLVRGTVSTSFGIQAEAKTVTKIEIQEQTEIKKDESFYTYPVCSIGNMRFEIVGKIDGIENEAGEKVLIEIKNRVKRLRKSVPEYEYVQVQTYLHMIGLTKAKLIEQYNAETHTEVITYSEKYWNEVIIPELKRFCIEFQRKTTGLLLANEALPPSPKSDSYNSDSDESKK